MTRRMAAENKRLVLNTTVNKMLLKFGRVLAECFRHSRNCLGKEKNKIEEQVFPKISSFQRAPFCLCEEEKLIFFQDPECIF